ncbi:hypothetical protein B1813_01105 [Saccharomonospora piscinae]|uniref:Putative regulatory protein FmdB zinc ribbon domain-containing protein n=2 Tax=Saccharomonospora piscinae TaxID=687388 RepID=A0A1V9ADC1_SACPI|nr:hypothetical protein B1813_01105 [Saccharomonospora piscinae]TLW95321.1 zinc ribbon domain-containing protein [Saccharomonospora piscinae]
MVIYSYRCAGCGEFDVRLPMGRAGQELPCPVCGAAAARRFGTRGVLRGSAALTRAVEAAEGTAERPGVVSGPSPRSRGPRVSRDPRHARLPRP